ncbi:MAG TPA: hypothetical protein VM580_10000, partial [Labilithrix sp.]|nr:hypothetical protein [Labilithrix sp.]
MAVNELTKALLLEEVAAPRAIGEALFASVNGGVPLPLALLDSGAASPETLARYLERSEAPFVRHVTPAPELVARLPPGLCQRLLALPVRYDGITGTVDVVVADPSDPHPANEISYHLGTQVRVIRAPIAAIEEAFRRMRLTSRDLAPPRAIRRPEAPRPHHDMRPQAAPRYEYDAPRYEAARYEAYGDPTPMASRKMGTLPPEEPALSQAIPSTRDYLPRRGLVLEADSAPPHADLPAMQPRTHT